MMVNAMVADKALTKEDIAELYEILEQAEKANFISNKDKKRTAPAKCKRRPLQIPDKPPIKPC